MMEWTNGSEKLLVCFNSSMPSVASTAPPPVLDARVVVHGNGMWQLRLFVSARESTRLLGEGEWRQVGDSLECWLLACDASPNVDEAPVSFDIEGDRLRLNRTLAGSLYGLLGFRLVSPLPER